MTINAAHEAKTAKEQPPFIGEAEHDGVRAYVLSGNWTTRTVALPRRWWGLSYRALTRNWQFLDSSSRFVSSSIRCFIRGALFL